jgi:mRNA interferase RelE/StbE
VPRYSLEFRPAALRAFSKLDPAVRRRLAPAIDALMTHPRPAGVKHLAGPHDLWRMRVGAYRIVYAIHDDRLVIVVVRIGPRGGVYRGL